MGALCERLSQNGPNVSDLASLVGLSTLPVARVSTLNYKFGCHGPGQFPWLLGSNAKFVAHFQRSSLLIVDAMCPAAWQGKGTAAGFTDRANPIRRRRRAAQSRDKEKRPDACEGDHQ